MIVNIQETYNNIEKDIIDNQKDIFNLYNYYTHKYRGNRLNDINLGLFLNDSQQPVAQIFIRNKTGYIRSHIIFNREGNTILDIKTLNHKINE